MRFFYNLFCILWVAFFFSYEKGVFAQNQNVGINKSGALPDVSALLDVDASPANDKGILIPRVSLISDTDVVTISSPAVSLLVYNTNSAITNGNGVGYYYWSGTKWLAILVPQNGPGSTGQVLASQGSGNPPQWVASGRGGGCILLFNLTLVTAVTATSSASPQTILNITSGGGVLYSHIVESTIPIGSALEVWVRVTIDGIILNGGFFRITNYDNTGGLAIISPRAKGPYFTRFPIDNTTIEEAVGCVNDFFGEPFCYITNNVHCEIIGAMGKISSYFNQSDIPFKNTCKIEIYKTNVALTVNTRVWYGTP